MWEVVDTIETKSRDMGMCSGPKLCVLKTDEHDALVALVLWAF